ncbi:MAG TPA: PaaI family thioesterase [Deltaproteobacteria bacterium]|nr:PaaI family thioesterase [Deltaproteobacteria bacterium]HQB39093.1 PaaI family thioesterase [Deltaproteobacteria bacterium]
MDHSEHIRKHLDRLYARNPFVLLLGMEIVAISHGMVEITMPVDAERHANSHNMLHGGAVASLADTAMGVACATYGNRVVTVDLNINYIRNACVGDLVRGIGRVVHCGRNTMVVDGEMLGRDGRLIAKSRATFMNVGRIEGFELED